MADVFFGFAITSISQFRSLRETRGGSKVRFFLEKNKDHLTILKLKRNEQLTQQDLLALEQIFMSEGVAEEDDLARIQAEGGLGLFIRSLVGLEKDAAKQAFSEFIDGKTLTANQLEFLGLVVDHLTERGIMEPARLYESPFTDIDDQGVVGIFEAAEIEKLMDILNDVKTRTAVWPLADR